MLVLSMKKRLFKTITMKKAIIAGIIFALFLLVSACNKQVCPAYSQTDTEQTDQNS
jgi:hypothetical protein